MSTLKVFAKQAPQYSTIVERGWGNGYVCIPYGHHMHGLDYDEIHRRYDIDVSGGLTFSEAAIQCKTWGIPDFVNETDWIVGFDTAHYGDDMDTWPNEASVLAEAQRLADQIIATVPYQSPEDIKQELVTRLQECVERMDKCRNILQKTAGNHAGNWGILDTSEARETLKKVIQ